MRSVRPAAATRCFKPSTNGRLSTVVSPITTAEKSGYRGRSRHIASTNRSLPFCRRTRPKVPIAYRPVEARLGKGGAPVGGRGIEIDIDAVMNDRRRARQILRRHLAGRDHGVHPCDQKVREPGFRALGGRIEDQRKAGSRADSGTARRSSRHCGARARCGPCPLGGRKRRHRRSRTVRAAIPPGRSGPSHAARHRLAIKGAMVRFTAVPPE